MTTIRYVFFIIIRLNHPRLVKMIEAFQGEREIVVVMEHLAGDHCHHHFDYVIIIKIIIMTTIFMIMMMILLIVMMIPSIIFVD